MVEEKTVLRRCQKCGGEIKPEERCYQISTSRFIGKNLLFRVYLNAFD